MKKKNFKRFSILIAVASLLISSMAFCVTFYGLNPERANRIFCKVLVFLEFNRCNCAKPKSTTVPKKKSTKTKNLRKAPCRISKDAKLSLVASDTQKWLSFGLIHLANFLVVKLILLPIKSVFDFVILGEGYEKIF